jgi:hypothetical protein
MSSNRLFRLGDGRPHDRLAKDSRLKRSDVDIFDAPMVKSNPSSGRLCQETARGREMMSKRIVQHPINTAHANQTPFERFSASLKQVLSVSKQDLPQLAKKSKKQK